MTIHIRIHDHFSQILFRALASSSGPHTLASSTVDNWLPLTYNERWEEMFAKNARLSVFLVLTTNPARERSRHCEPIGLSLGIDGLSAYCRSKTLSKDVLVTVRRRRRLKTYHPACMSWPRHRQQSDWKRHCKQPGQGDNPVCSTRD